MSRKNATGSHRARLLVLTRLGTLRLMLALTALVMLFGAPAPGTRPDYHGWGMIPTLIVPTLAPIVFMVLLLDAMMSAVFMVDKRGAARARLKYIVFLHLLLAATLMVVWYPYFRAIM
ncbi:MAG TPA: hypothetical protein VEI74_07705 [Candidatus Methylomirabilis sp.]|nr:hypothetical protein [Candidatus Methylomirabilis sp.]